MDVNEHERLSNFTFRFKLNSTMTSFFRFVDKWPSYRLV